MKSFLILLFVFLLNHISFTQNIYNSSDVKLKAPLKQNWVYKAGNIILNQRVVDNTCFINTLDGINAISVKDGKELWSYSYSAKPIIPSVVTFSDKFAVYITYNYDEQTEIGTSSLVLVDLSTGKEKWRQKSEETWYKPTPFLDDKNVYIIAGPPDDWEENKNYNKMELDRAILCAFSNADGNVVWQQDLWDEESELIQVDGDYLFTIHDFDISDSGSPKNKLSCFAISNGTELWKYNPSSMITKAFIGDVKLKDSILYAFPTKGAISSISAINLVSGEELWQRNYIAVDRFYFLNNRILTYGNGATESATYIGWCAFELNDGETYFCKTISSSSSFGFIFKDIFANTIFGRIAAVVNAYSDLFSSSFGAIEGQTPQLIPTSSLFTGLSNTNILSDEGLAAIYYDEEIPILNIMNAIHDDDKKVEYKLSKGIMDLSMANGISPTSAFITYEGKVASIRIADGTQEWIKEFDPNSTSLGLIIKDDKMYLFTSKSVFQLQNE